MIPATIDFLLRTNADYGETIQFTNGSDGPIDLTGMSFVMQIREYPGGPLIMNVPLSVIDAANGQVQIGPFASPNRVGDFSHDWITKHGDGLREPWAQGTVQIEQGVTQNG